MACMACCDTCNASSWARIWVRTVSETGIVLAFVFVVFFVVVRVSRISFLFTDWELELVAAYAGVTYCRRIAKFVEFVVVVDERRAGE